MALLEYKCPNCGGPIDFNPGAQEMVCPYCDSTIDLEALKAMDELLHEEQTAESVDWEYAGTGWESGEQDGMAVYACNSCGGEIIGDETLGATTCPFCGNRVVISSKFSGTLRPDLVIPFKFNKDQAKEALTKHYEGKKLLPKVFKDQNHIDEIKGVYVPFWLFDADADVNAIYEATKVRSWSDSENNYQETSHYHVHRAGDMGFVHVPVDGSKAIDDTLMESVEPFDMNEAVDFQTAYLAGYFANKYDVDAEQSYPRADERIKRSASQAFYQTVKGYNTVNTTQENINLTSGGIKYGLLPVYLLATSWNGETYQFAMNGQTGKFVGNLPMDKGRYWSWFFRVFGIAAVVLVGISQLLVR